MKISCSSIVLLVLVMCVALPSWTSAAPEAGSPPGPTVRVVSPSGGVANLVMPSGEAKVLVVVEVTDRSGSGLDTDDSGTPRFDNADSNVSLFRSHIVKKSEYTNHLGQTVVQLFAEVPLKDVVFSTEMKLTPPINSWSPNVQGRKKGFVVPQEAMNDVAIFKFRVRDRSGNTTEPKKDENQLLVAVAWSLYTPPPESETDPKAPGRPATPPDPTSGSEEGKPPS